MSLTSNKLYLILFTTCLAGYIWLYYDMATAHSTYSLDVCLFKQATNIPCPSCGTTRALSALVQGHYLESLYINPLGVFAFACLCVIPLWIVGDLVFRKKTLFAFYCRAEQIVRQPRFAIPLILLVAANWIWNITKGL